MDLDGPSAFLLVVGAVVGLTVFCPPFAQPVACFEGGTVWGGPFPVFIQCSGGAPNVPPDPLIVRYNNLALDLVIWGAVGAAGWAAWSRRP